MSDAPHHRTPLPPASGHPQHLAPAEGSGSEGNGLGIASLVLGILGFMMVLPLIGPVLALVFGKLARRKRRDGLALAGMWVGGIALILQIIFLLALGGLWFASAKALSDRDTTRHDDLDYTKKALERYYNAHSYYPKYLSEIQGADMGVAGLKYEMRKDPRPESGYAYTYTAGPSGCSNTTSYWTSSKKCTTYALTARLEQGGSYTVTSD